MKRQIMVTSEKGGVLKLLSRVPAYAVRIFIFLIPIIGVFAVMS